MTIMEATKDEFETGILSRIEEDGKEFVRYSKDGKEASHWEISEATAQSRALVIVLGKDIEVQSVQVSARDN